MKRALSTLVILMGICFALEAVAEAPPRAGRAGGPPPGGPPSAPPGGLPGGLPPDLFGPPPPDTRTAKAAAPTDFTGTWVSPVFEDYRWRMVTPLKGDYAGIPYKFAVQKIIDSWDPAKDEAAGLQCKAYGAPALMRIPGRIRISWQDANTLKIESDQGNQVRLLHFKSATGTDAGTAPPSLQGYSVAKWEGPQLATAGGVALGTSARWGTRSNALEVTTSNLQEGYLRKNGVPYSDKAKLTEYFDRFSEPDGTEWFTVTTIVEDPTYLTLPFVTTTDYRRERNDSKFSPSPCSAR